MVNGVGGPDQICRAEPVELVRELGPLGGDSAGRASTGVLQQGRRLVDGNHLCVREGIGEQAGDYARPTPDVERTPHVGAAQQIT